MSAAVARPPALDPDTLVVALANAPYDAPVRTSKHAIVAELARRQPVLYVEPPPLTLGPVVKPSERGRFLAFRAGVRRPSGGPAVVAPPPFRQALDTRSRVLDGLNQVLLGRFLRRTVRRLPHRRVVFLSFVYNFGRVARLLAPDVTAFYCVDLWPDMGIPFARRATVARVETESLAQADVVFAASRALADRLRRRHPAVVHAPHGVDAERFAAAALPGPLPADLACIPAPRIGFVGSLEHWVDVALLRQVARARRDWQLCLVGPTGGAGRLRALAAEPNVHLLGWRRPEATVDYLRGFAVGVIPFVASDLTHCSNPLKAYEYLAAGLPVVSTPLPELHDFAPHVRFGADAPAFVGRIETALAHWGPAERGAAMRAVAGLAWSRRVDDVVAALDRAHARRTTPIAHYGDASAGTPPAALTT